MAGTGTHRLRTRRLFASVGVLGILAAVGPPSAFAQAGLPGLLPSALATDPVDQTVEQVTATATQVIPETPRGPTTSGTESVAATTEEATNEPLQAAAQTVNSTVDTAQTAAKGVAGTAQKTVDAAARTVNRTVPPVADQAQKKVDTAATTVNQAVAPVADTAQRTVDDVAATANQAVTPLARTAETTAQTVLQTAEPVVTQLVDSAGTATSSLPIAGGVVGPVVGGPDIVVDDTLSGAGTTVDAVQPVIGDAARTTSTASGLLSPASTPPQAAQAEAASVLEPPAARGPTTVNDTFETGAAPVWATTSPSPQPLRPTPRDFQTPRIPWPGVSITLPSAPVGDLDVTPRGGMAMSSHSHAPLPDIPSGPLTTLLSASASAGGGALVILLAALAAALSLAAPGLGRRLRPALAPWPQPILQLSLERPG